jgi:glycosyltransferase involved in cell wall biosynthesis
VSIAIVNAFLSTLGGGERSTVAFARALADLCDDDVVLYTVAPSVSTRTLERTFGIPLHGVTLHLCRSGEALASDIRRGRHSLFVNHSFGSRMRNPAPVGLYAMMFPLDDDQAYLASYDVVLCNSRFTADYVRLRAGPRLPATDVAVLYPPIAARLAADASDKDWRLIVNLGRYQSGGHCKNQLMLGQEIQFLNRHRGSDSFRFVCSGRITDADYYRRCQVIASDDIRFERSLPEAAVNDLLRSAAFYLHGTGLGLQWGELPEACEHFGLAIVEAMSAGAIPLAYGRGGIVEVIDHGVNGWLYHDPHEIIEYLMLMASYTESERRQMSDAARFTARRYTQDAFVGDLARVLGRASRLAPA